MVFRTKKDPESYHSRANVQHIVTNNNTGGCAIVYWEGVFPRLMKGAGVGVNSAVEVIKQTASLATDSAARDIGTITVTAVETNEYMTTVNFQIDLTGTAVVSAQVVCDVELTYDVFLTPPVIAAA